MALVGDAQPQRPQPLGRAAALNHALLVLAPVVTACLLVRYVVHHEFALDFERAYWVAAHRILHGADPYVWTRGQIAAGVAFAYPAPAGLLLVPFALLPRGLAAALFVAAQIAAVVGALRVLSVRDWRLYPFVLLLWPVVNAWQTGNVTLLLLFLLALVWRQRDDPVRAGLIAALAIAVKPFVWPIALWLIATRRLRATGWTVASTLAMNLVAWAVVGPGTIHAYLRVDTLDTRLAYRTGYALLATVARIGGSRTDGSVVMLVVSAALALACLWLGRRREGVPALAVAVALMLAASPLVWNHYFALLILPLAIARPRLTRAWLALLPLWLCPALHVHEWQSLLATLTTAALTWELVRPPGLDERRAGAAHVLALAEPGERLGDPLSAG